MSSILLFLLCLASTSTSAAEQAVPVVHTAQGRVRGRARDGGLAFYGIPYATLNDSTRFKRAGVAPTWSDVREAQPSRCSLFSKPEECLRLDVHTPTGAGGVAGPPWPVLVWVAAAGARYDPDRLVREGIIVVVVCHRQGPLGFLCLGEEMIPGNSGAKDVVLALRWVRDNISAFQGDPHKVTVAGQSYGAAIVEGLILSPMAQDLFHGAILQSGSILCPWAFNYDAKERGLSFSYMLNESELDVKHASEDDLAIQSKNLPYPYFPFSMCAEKRYKFEEIFLPDAPYRTLSNQISRRVPLMMGYNTNEAYVFLSVLKQLNVLRRMSKDLSIILPDELKFVNEIELKQVTKQVQDTYFKNNLTMAALLDFHRDAYFVSHIHKSARLHATSTPPVYYYQFSHAGENGVGTFPGVKKVGAAHSDELAYLFPASLRDMQGEGGIVQRNLIRLWVNFVKYLNPTPEDAGLVHWDALDPREPRLLDIGAELAMVDYPHERTSQFWDDIYERFYYGRNNPGGH